VIRLRILHCLRAPVGGLFRHVRDLAVAQSQRGHLVGVLCDAQASDPLTASRLDALVPHLALGLERIAMPRDIGLDDAAAVAATRRLAAAMRIDILHGHGAKGGAYGRLAGSMLKRRGLPVASIYTPHGGSLHYAPNSLKGRVFMGLEQRLGRVTDGLLFESAYAARVYAAHVGTPDCLTRIVHNGIGGDEIRTVEHSAGAADFLFIGELRQLKGVDVLIEAVAAIQAMGRAVTAIIVGAGPDEGAFRALSRERGVETSVRFAGAMPAGDAFRLGRVLVMPSRAESLPYVAIEAGGAGLPLVATDVGGVGEIVEGTGTRLVAPGDAAALAERMLECLDRPEESLRIALALQARIAARFSVGVMADGVLDAYAVARGTLSQPFTVPARGAGHAA
jgi:glycosyltransferase involved in cell wall biosynthesis